VVVFKLLKLVICQIIVQHNNHNNNDVVAIF